MAITPKDMIIAKLFGNPLRESTGTATPSIRSVQKPAEEETPVRGPGKEKEDKVPAVLVEQDMNSPQPSQTPAKLSPNEFVIPSDVVNKLGKGNPEKGAAVLQELVDRILNRQEDI